MNYRTFLRKTVIVTVVFQLALGQTLFAATTNKDLTLDDGTSDSPKLILQDETGNNTLTLQKLDGGAAELINNEGSIDFKPSAITDDYLSIVTEGSGSAYASSLYWLGVLSYVNAPGLRVDPATGKLEYRDGGNAGWATLESITGSVTFSGLTDTTISSIAQGDVVYYKDVTDGWVNLGIGTASQVLAVNAGETAPEWVTKATTNAGSVTNDTLRWDGNAWIPSTALTNDNTDITVSNDLTVTGNVAVNGGDITTTDTAANLFNTTATSLNIGGVSVATAIGSTASGTTTIGYDLAVTRNTTVTGNVAVNGGDITTTDTAANLFNTTATSLNIGGVSVATAIGSTTSGTTTIGYDLTVINNIATNTFQMANGAGSNYVLKSDASGNAFWASGASAVTYKGTWNASPGNYPGGPALGDSYIIHTGGTMDSVTYAVGDWAIYNGSSWEKVASSSLVDTVNGEVGIVVVDQIMADAQTTTKISATFGLLKFENAGSETMRLITGGRVGIGRTSPTALLHLGPTTSSAAQFRLDNTAANPSSPEIGDIWFNGTNLNFRKDGSTTIDLLIGAGTLDDAYNAFGGVAALITVDASQGQTTGLEINTTAAADQVGLTIDQDDNDKNALVIENAGTGAAIDITGTTGTVLSATKTEAGKWLEFADDTDTFGLYNRAGTPENFITANTGSLAIDTAAGALYIKTSDTADDDWTQLALGTTNLDQAYNSFGAAAALITVDAAESQTTGLEIYITSAADQVGLTIDQDDLDKDALVVENAGIGNGIFINQDGEGVALNIDSESTTANIAVIDGAALTIGSGLLVTSSSIDGSARNLVDIVNSGLGSNSTIALRVQQVSNGDGIFIDQDGVGGVALNIESAATIVNIAEINGAALTTGTALSVSGLNALTSGSGLSVTSDSATTGARNLVNIVNDNTASTGTTALRVQQDSTGAILRLFNDTTEVVSVFDGGSVGIGTVNPASRMEIEVADAGNVSALTLDQDDATNNNDVLVIENAGTGTPIKVTNTASGKWMEFIDTANSDTFGLYNGIASPEGAITAATGSLAIDTAAGALYIKTSDTGDTGWSELALGTTNLDQAYNAFGNNAALITVDAGQSQTTGLEIYITSAADQVGLTIDQDDLDKNALVVENAGIGDGIFIDQDGVGGVALNIDSEATTSNIVVIDGAVLTEGTALSVTGLDALTSGGGLSVTSGATALTGPLASVSLTGSAAANTGSLLLIADSGALNENAPFKVTAAGAAAQVAALIENTGSGTSFKVSNTGTGNGIFIDQEGEGVALNIYSESTTSNIAVIDGAVLTEGTGLSVTGLDLLTTGSGLSVTSNSLTTDTRNLVNIVNANAASAGTTALGVQQVSTGNGIFIDQDGNGVALNIDSEATTVNIAVIDGAALTEGTALSVTGLDALTSGGGLSVASGATALTGDLASISLTGDNVANTGSLLLIADSGAANTTTPFKVTADGAAGQVAALIENTGSGTSFRVNDEASDSTPFIIDAAGLVGIGTITPASALHITPATAAALQIDPFNTATGETGEMRFLELAATGANYVGFKAPDLLAGDVIWTLPAADGAANQLLMTDGSGTLTWASPSSNALADETDNALLIQEVSAGPAYIEIDTLDATAAIKFGNASNNPAYSFLGTGNVTVGGDVGIGTAAPASALHITPATAAALQIDPFNTATGNTGEMRFLELAASGTNYVGFKAPDDAGGSNTIWTLPAADGTTDQVLKTNGSGVLSWTTASVGDITAVGDILTGAAFTATAGADGTTLYFEGSTTDAFEVALTSADPGSDVTLTLPAATDTLVGRDTTDTLTNKTLTSAVLSTDVSGTAVLDEDDMSANSATQLATQQSIKAYVDSQVGGGDITAVGNITTGAAFTATTGNDGTTLYFEGSTADEFEVALTSDDPTSDVTLTLPNVTGSLLTEEQIDVSSELLTIVTDETGTGALVFADTPTLVTPVIGVATGTSIDLGGTTLLASRSLTVDTAGGFDINMGTDAGDDFTIDTTGFVYEGDTGNVGIGTAAPGQTLTVEGTFGILETGDTPTFHTIFQGGDQGADITYTLPAADGSDGQVLKTNGSGVLSWTAASGVFTHVEDGVVDGSPDLVYFSDDLVIADGADFVFGSHKLADTGTGNEDSRMFFDTSKSAFRVGITDSSSPTADYWNDGNVGDHSFAAGYNTTASGQSSFAACRYNIASGNYSTSMGLGGKAKAVSSFVIGVYGEADGHELIWNHDEPVFVIGNGQNGPRSNSMVVLKNGKIGIHTDLPKAFIDIPAVNVLVKPEGTDYADWAQIRLQKPDPIGTDPATPLEGDLWYNGTELYFRDSTTSINLLAAGLISGLGAAGATNTIDNTNFAQVWEWSSADVETALAMNFDGLTTGTGMKLASSSTGLTTGTLASISLTGSDAANTGNLLLVADTGAANTTTPFKVTAKGAAGQVAALIENTGLGTSFKVSNTGGGNGIFIDQDGDGVALNIDSAATTANIAVIDGAALTTGSGLLVTSDSATTDARNLVSIVNDNTASTETTALRVQQDSAGDILNLFDDTTEVFTVLDGGNVGIGTDTPGSALHIAPSTEAALQIDPFFTAAGNTGEMRFLELVANGTNYVGFKAPDLLAENVIWTLPAADGSDGQVLKTDGSGALSWTAGSALISGLGAADATNTIDNTNFTQVWNWSSATTETGLAMNFDDLTSGTGMALASDATGLTTNGTLASISLTGSAAANTGNLLLIADSGAANKTTPFKVTAAGAADQVAALIENTGSGTSFRVNDEDSDSTPFIIDSAGNVTVGGNTTVGGTLTVTGTSQFSSAVGIGQVPESAAHLALGATTTAIAQINLDNTAADPSAPNVGDLWFNDNKLNFRKDDSTTVDLLAAGGGWSTSGNASTNPPTDFLGTTDAKALVIKTSNTERMRILSDGKVGIGTATPLSNVWGAAKVLEISNDGQVDIAIDNTTVYTSSGTAIGAFSFNRDTVKLAYIQGNTDGTIDSGRLSFVVKQAGGNMKSAMHIKSTGKVGIGTSNPQSPLHIYTTAGVGLRVGKADNYLGLRWEDGSGDAFIENSYNSTSADILFRARTSGTAVEIMRLTGYGRVGIGTSVPKSKLDVEGGIAVGTTYSGTTAAPTNGMIIEGQVGIGTSTNLYGALTITTGSGNISFDNFGMYRSDSTSNSAGLIINRYGYQGGTTYFRDTIISDGKTNTVLYVDGSAANVGIGKTNPTYTLDVAGTIRSTGDVTVGGVLTVSGNNITFGNGESISNATNGTVKVTVASNGNLEVVTGNLKVGGGTPTWPPNGADVYVNGTLEVDGNARFDGNALIYGNTNLGNADTDLITANGTFQGASPLVFEGGTADGWETTFDITNPTGDRTITFQDESGTVAFISDITGDITAVGSMTSGAAFAGTAADDAWLGLGSGAGRIAFDNQPTDYVNILSANVGIGTTTPKSRLDVEGGIAVGSSYSGETAAPSNGMIIQGRVGIGDSSPDSALDILSSSASNTQLTIANTNASYDPQIGFQIVDGTNKFVMGVDDSSTDDNFKIVAGANLTSDDGITIRSSTGGVGIGGYPGNYQLYVGGTTWLAGQTVMIHSSSAGYVAQIQNTSTNDSADGLKIHIQGDGSMTTSNTYIQFTNDSSPVHSAGRIHANGNTNITLTSGGEDFAEYYYTDDIDLQTGEVVSIDNTKEKTIRRSIGAYDNVIGVISDNFIILGNDDEEYHSDPHYQAVGLIGRVPVFVSTENGNIMPGDPLASGSIPGVAIKATKPGFIIGRASESYTESDPQVTGKIKVYIKSDWYNGEYNIHDAIVIDEAFASTKLAFMNIDQSGNAVFTGDVSAQVGSKVLKFSDLSTSFEELKAENAELRSLVERMEARLTALEN